MIKKLSLILFIFSNSLLGQNPVMLTDGYTNGIINENDTLYALVRDHNGFKLESTIVIKIDSFYNPAKDLKLPEYKIDENIKPIVLFKNIDLKKENIKGEFLDFYFLEPNSEISFNLINSKSTVKAIGTVEHHKNFKLIHNYEILVNIIENDLEKEYSIIKVPSAQWTNKNFIEAPKIIWVGDIDNDNKIDFIIEESTHYTMIKRSLYLSSEIKEKNYVRKILVEDSID